MKNNSSYHAVSFSIAFPEEPKKIADITAVIFLTKRDRIDLRINSIRFAGNEAADILHSGLWDTTYHRESRLWRCCEELAEAANYVPQDQWLAKLDLTPRKLFIKTRLKEVILIHPQGMVITCHYEAASVSTEANPSRVEIMSELIGFTIDDVYISRRHDNWHFNEAFSVLDDPAYEMGSKLGFDCPYCWTKEFFNLRKPLVLTDYFSPPKNDGKPTSFELLAELKYESVETAKESHPDDDEEKPNRWTLLKP